MLEREVEEYLRKVVNALGGHSYKFTSPNRRNVPDRMVIMPCGTLFFVECKSTHGKLTKGQHREIARLRELKQTVHVVNSIEKIREILKPWAS